MGLNDLITCTKNIKNQQCVVHPLSTLSYHVDNLKSQPSGDLDCKEKEGTGLYFTSNSWTLP